MNTQEVFKALLEGKKVRVTWWESKKYIWLEKDGLYSKTQTGNIYSSVIITENEDWEIYEEPKPTECSVCEDITCQSEAPNWIKVLTPSMVMVVKCGACGRVIPAEKPKKKVKYAPALYVFGSDEVVVSSRYYANDSEVKGNKGFKRLLWEQAVEVEE